MSVAQWSISFAIVAGPGLFLVGAGGVAAVAARRVDWWRVAVLTVASTACWLVFVALVPHEDPCAAGSAATCPNVFGTTPWFGGAEVTGALVLVAGFLVPALWARGDRGVPPLVVGAALVVGPLTLAWPTAPRGDDDGLWALVFLYLAALGWGAVLVSAIAGGVVRARRARAATAVSTGPASAIERLLAAVLDIGAVAVVLTVPLTAMSHAGLEVAAFVVGVVVGVAALSIPTVVLGGTSGQRLLGLSTCDRSTGERLGWRRSTLRAVIVVAEVVMSVTIVLAVVPAVEVLLLVATGATATDRVTGSTVVARHRSTSGAATGGGAPARHGGVGRGA